MNFKNLISKKRSIWILIILLILGGWALLRSCSSDHVGKKKVYLIARDSTWYANPIMGKDRNLQAFMNDLFADIGQEMHLHFNWLEINPAYLTVDLAAGNYDAILSSMQPSIINQSKFLFSNLLYAFGSVLVVNKNSSATSLEDMQNKTIGIPQNFNLYFSTLKKSGAHAYDFFIVIYDNMNKALEALERNQIDGIIMYAIPAYTYSEGFYLNKIKVITPPLNDQGLRLVTINHPSMHEFFDDFDKTLSELKKNGRYNQLIKKWNLIDPETRFSENIPKTQDNPKSP